MPRMLPPKHIKQLKQGTKQQLRHLRLNEAKQTCRSSVDLVYVVACIHARMDALSCQGPPAMPKGTSKHGLG